MLRLPLTYGRDGSAMTLELSDDDARDRIGQQSVLFLRQPGDDPLPLDDQTRAHFAGRASLVVSHAVSDAQIEQLIDHVGGWENVFYHGEPIACSRTLLGLVLRVNDVRALLERAVAAARRDGVCLPTSRAVASTTTSAGN